MAEPQPPRGDQDGDSTPTGTGVVTVIRRLAGFAIFPLLALVVPFLLMPVIGHVVGDAGWSSAMSGQVIGTIASVVIQWGWNVDGTVQIATTTSDAERAAIYARSVRTRLLLTVIVVPLAVALAGFVVAPAFWLDTSAMTIAYAMMGLSPAWYCIGVGRPALLGIYDTLPRFVATAVAAPAVYYAGALWPFPVLMLVTTAATMTAFQRRFAAGQQWFPTHLRQTFHDLREQRHTAGINLAGQVYAQTPTPIATRTLSPLESGTLASADVLYRLGLFSVVALGNAFQGWTLEPHIANRRQRHLAAMGAHLILGVAGIAVIVVAGPPVSALISGSAAVATTSLCLYYGCAFAFLSAATPLIRNVLIPAGRQPLVLRVTLIAAVLGITAMVAAGLASWTDGIAIGMALSELAMLLLLLPPAIKVLNQEGDQRGT